MAAKALGHQMSRIVHVRREDLIKILTENREKHVKEFDAAMAGYKEMALKKIEDAFVGLAEKLATKKDEMIAYIGTFTAETASQFPGVLTILQGVSVQLPVPVSYADAYDAAIDMAKFEVRDVIELSGAEFQCFCRDVWDWSYSFAELNSTYTGGRR